MSEKSFPEYTGPSNLALVTYILIMCNLFGRQYLSKTFAQKNHIEMLRFKYPSMAVLPLLHEAARKVLIEHDGKILLIFEGYALASPTKSAGKMGVVENVLPLSKIRYYGTDVDSSSEFRRHLKNNAIPVVVRSSFFYKHWIWMSLNSCKL